jgi:isopenicillin N synthase-like dioxygenase
VRTTDDRWVDVAPDLSAFVVNTGEMMRRWSNNNVVATPHRVVNRTGQERYSVAYFFDPHMHTIVSPLASCGRSDPDLEPVRFDDYVRHQLEATYDQHRGTD